MNVSDRANLLLTDLPKFCDYDVEGLSSVSRRDLDAIQLKALQYRFSELRNAIPILKKLSDSEGIEKILTFDEVVPLLFDHAVYKSYPLSLLEENKFKLLNKWLNKLTSHDLTDVDVSQCESIDDWMLTMDEATPLRISHSSGTSGVMSFIPQTVSEWDKVARNKVVEIFSCDPSELLPEVHVIYPYFRSGSSSHLRANDGHVKYLLGGVEERFHAAYPYRLSSDVQFLAARIGAARAKGTLDRLEITPDQLEKKTEFEKLQADMPQHLNVFFSQVFRDLSDKKVVIQATWNLLHNMALAGLEKGITNVFSSGCHITTGGGAKGMKQPEGWMDDVKRFTGAKEITEIYAMSEVPVANKRCEKGHYHFDPTVIPFVLDPKTSAPLPRKGKVTGRAALFDLNADSRWGGFITGDEITVEWDKPCECGRLSRYIVGGIQRYSEKNGGDDKITCASSESSNREAMNYLNDQLL